MSAARHHIETTFASEETARLAGISYRKLNHWCCAGIFGPDRQNLGSGSRRRFTAEDVLVLRAINRLSGALATAGDRSLGTTELYARLADQVRAGAVVVRIQLAEHVELTVDVADLVEEAAA